MRRDVFHFKTIDVSFARARRFMRDDPEQLFTPAVEGCPGSPSEILGSVETDHEGLFFERDVILQIGEFEEIDAPLPLARRRLSWHAAEHAGMFPILIGELEAFPLDEGRTQVTFTCHYRPPLKAIGAIADTLYLHRVAEECVERFFGRVLECLSSSAESVQGNRT